jgi:putative transposase
MSKLARLVRSPSSPPRSVRAFLVTSATWERRPLFRSERMARLFREVLYTYREQTPFRLHEFALMPDHFHLLVSLPPGVTIERVVQLLKVGFSFQARKELGFASEVWQRGFADRYIRSARGFETCAEYVRGNPVRARLSVGKQEYPYSSAYGSWALDARPEHLSG